MNLQMPLLRCVNGRAPSFERTLSAMGEVVGFFYAALESGSAHMRLYFETQSDNEKPRPHVREMLVRDQAKRYLQQHQFTIEDEALSVGNEPLSALLVRCGSVQIRILKGQSGVIPGCGDSLGRRKFYNQRQSSYIEPGTKQIRTTRLNLVLLWGFDEAFNIPQLWLACPLRAGEKSADVLTQWLEPLPHPVFSQSVPASSEDARRRAEEDLEQLLRNTEPAEESAEEA